MSQEKITVKAECPDCGATGLYAGWKCHDGAAVVCQRCKGNAFIILDYVPFEGRKEKKGVKRIFSSADSWIHLYTGKKRLTNGTVVDFSQYGITPEEFNKGERPDPLPDECYKT